MHRNDPPTRNPQQFEPEALHALKPAVARDEDTRVTAADPPDAATSIAGGPTPTPAETPPGATPSGTTPPASTPSASTAFPDTALADTALAETALANTALADTRAADSPTGRPTAFGRLHRLLHRRTARRLSRRIGRFTLGLALFIAAAYLGTLILGNQRGNVVAAASAVMLGAAVVGLLVVGGFVHEVCHWQRPALRLRRSLEDIRGGRAAISELQDVGGGLIGVAPLVAATLHDLRREQQRNLQLEAEMRRRLDTRSEHYERQLSSLQRQSEHDKLTGCLNRRSLDRMMPSLLAECVQRHVNLSVLMIDVDNFKQLNDTLGHAAGDKLLASIGQLIRSGIRDADVAFRYGGDEFVVLMPAAGLPDAKDVAGRLERTVEALAGTLRLASPPGLSVGVATLRNLPGADAAQLLSAADANLYKRKFAKKQAA